VLNITYGHYISLVYTVNYIYLLFEWGEFQKFVLCDIKRVIASIVSVEISTSKLEH